MNAITLIEKAKRVNIALYLVDGQLRYRGDRQTVEPLLPELQAHRAEVIEALRHKTEGEFIHWQKLTPEQRQGILSTIKGGDPVRVYSKVLSETVWWVRDEQTAEVLRQDPRYQGEVIYNLTELVQIQGKPPEFLRDIHRFKKEFGATLARTEPKPMLRAGLAIITAGEVRP